MGIGRGIAAAAKERALEDIRGVAVEIASLAAVKLTGLPADPRRVAAAVDATLAERA